MADRGLIGIEEKIIHLAKQSLIGIEESLIGIGKTKFDRY